MSGLNRTLLVSPTARKGKETLQSCTSMAGGSHPMVRTGVQGFASGDLERDAAAIRLFADAGLELLLAQVLPMTPS